MGISAEQGFFSQPDLPPADQINPVRRQIEPSSDRRIFAAPDLPAGTPTLKERFSRQADTTPQVTFRSTEPEAARTERQQAQPTVGVDALGFGHQPVREPAPLYQEE